MFKKFYVFLLFSTQITFCNEVVISNYVQYSLKIDNQSTHKNIVQDFNTLLKKNLVMVDNIEIVEHNDPEFGLQCNLETNNNEYITQCRLYNSLIAQEIFAKEYKTKTISHAANLLSNDLAFLIAKKKIQFDAKILFVADEADFRSSLSIMDLHGQNQQTLFIAQGKIMRPFVNKFDKCIYYTLLFKNGTIETYYYDTIKKQSFPIYTKYPILKNIEIISFAFSPDNSKVVISHNNKEDGVTPISVLNIQENKLTLLTDTKINVSPIFIDNNRIVFVSDRNFARRPTFYTMNVDSLFKLSFQLDPEAFDNIGSVYEPDFHTKHNLLTFTSIFNHEFGIFIYNMNDGRVYPIHNRSFIAEHPSFSQDGFFVSYSAKQSSKVKAKIVITPKSSKYHNNRIIETAKSATYPIVYYTE